MLAEKKAKKWIQLLRYIITGTLTTLIDLLIFHTLLVQFEYSKNISVLIAFICALLFSFFVNKTWTFASAKTNKKKSWNVLQFLKFLFVSAIGLILTLISVHLFITTLLLTPAIAKLSASAIVFVWNFLANSFWTFTSKNETDVIKPLLPEKKNFEFELSIVIPAYNESSRIIPTLKSAISYFTSQNIHFEIIVVDDGSTDQTSEICTQVLSSKNHKIIQLSKNKGKGFSVKTGVLESKGRYILFCDADGATPFNQYKKLRDAMLFSEIAIGSRYKDRSTVEKKQPLYRIIISRTVNIIAQIFLIEGISDTQCGFKLFRNHVGKEIFEKQKIERFAFDIEFLMLAKAKNYRITEIPVIWIDQDGSKVDGLRDGIRTLRDFVLIKFYMMFGFYKKNSD
ncbi:TPA: glycosyltransferase [Candidatus Peregrinibacteria bacterium]|nr:glycosyltransferase [Candidatus Peregrinibacteria bacterium]